jgi:outer membrane protein
MTFRSTLAAAAIAGAFAPPTAAAQATPGAALRADTSAARPIALAEAVQLAQRNAPSAVQARGQIRSSTTAVRSAYAAFIPTLSVQASTTQQSPAGQRVNQQTGEIVTGRWAGNAGFTANLDLFDGFRRMNDLRTARAQVSAAETGETAQRFQLAYQVKQQYYLALAARESEGAAGAQLQQAEQQLRVSVAKLAARTATRSDSLRSVIAVGNAQLALLNARNDRSVADAALTRLVATPFTVTATPEPTPTDVSSALTALPDSAELARLADNAPSVVQAQANLDAARASAKASRAPWLPTLSMSYGRNLSQTTSGFTVIPGDERRFTGNLRFNFSYPIFNQYTREEAIVRADIATVNAEATLRDARFAAQQQLVQSLITLRTAAEQARIQEQSVLAAEEDLRVVQQRYELGASTLLEVLTSQTQLNQARVALVQTRLNARIARAQLESIIGRDLAP